MIFMDEKAREFFRQKGREGWEKKKAKYSEDQLKFLLSKAGKSPKKR